MRLDVAMAAGLTGFCAGIAADLDLGRQQLLKLLGGFSPEQLDAVPPGLVNSVATLTLHICATEVSAAFRLEGQAAPEELKARYLIGQHRDRLPVAEGETLGSLTAKLHESRALLLRTLAGLGDTDLEGELSFGPERTATRRWYLALLPYHQASHIGQAQVVKTLLAGRNEA
ncbi:MAG: DinB family protein [Bacillota bacterium]